MSMAKSNLSRPSHALNGEMTKTLRPRVVPCPADGAFCVMADDLCWGNVVSIEDPAGSGSIVHVCPGHWPVLFGKPFQEPSEKPSAPADNAQNIRDVADAIALLLEVQRRLGGE